MTQLDSKALQQIRGELDLMQRFSGVYTKRFAEMIDELNYAPTPQTARHCLRLCVETLSMLLETQNHMALAMTKIADKGPNRQQQPLHRSAA